MHPSNEAAPALLLPAELTIYAAGELHPLWLSWMADAAAHGSEEAEVQASAVDQVDAAGLQMLLALQRGLADRGVRMRLADASQPLRQGCLALGLGEQLLQARDAEVNA